MATDRDRTADNRRAAAGSGRHAHRDPGAFIRAMHLLVPWSLAVAQPVLDILGKNPEFFATSNTPRGQVVAVAALITFGPLPVFWVIGLVAQSISRRLATVVHLVLFAALCSLLWMFVLHHQDRPENVVYGAAAILGLLTMAIYRISRGMQQVVGVMTFAPFVFLALFAFVSPAHKLVFPPPAKAHAATATGGAASRAPVVMIVFDELPLSSLLARDGSIDSTLYPNFARLAKGSTWFHEVSSVSHNTVTAVPAILSGVMPRSQGVLPTATDHPNSVFTLLAGSHDWSNAHESLTHMCPPDQCTGTDTASPDAPDPTRRSIPDQLRDVKVIYLRTALPKRAADRQPPIDDAWSGFGDRQESAVAADQTRMERTIDAFVTDLRPDANKPKFNFIHVLLPHYPWTHLPSGARQPYSDTLGAGNNGKWGPNQFLVDQEYERHLLQLQYADRFVGHVLDRMQQVGIYDRSVLLVTADHGIAFRKAEFRRRSTHIVDIVSVPLFVKAPHQRVGKVDDARVETIDALPTIADLLGVKMKWKHEGRSAYSPAANRNGRRMFMLDWVDVPDDMQPERQKTVDHRYELFGDDFFHTFGPHASDLVGTTPPAALPDSGATATIDPIVRKRLVDFTPGSRIVPAFLVGTIDHAPGDGIAVVLGGRIVATTETWTQETDHDTHWSVEVPEDALQDGNTVPRLLAISSTGKLSEITVR